MNLVAYVSTADSIDILSQWFTFYRRVGVERFHVFFSNPLGNPESVQSYLDLFSRNPVTVIESSVGSVDEFQRVAKITEYKSVELSSDRWVWTVDSDEFVSLDPELLSKLWEGPDDYLGGTLIDRFATLGALNPVEEGTSIFKQFPVQALFTADILKGTSTKVPLSRPFVRLGPGLHRVDEDPASVKRAELSVPVHHFKWTAGLVERLEARLASKFSCSQYQAEATYLLESCIEDRRRVRIEMTLSWVDREDQRSS
jgi:hypothetical protein